ncbi:MAG: hypothetical protein Q9190_000440 [Brigantiaea leucoxantha]
MATAAAKKITLVTGANAGIGFELAAQLMAKGSYHVLIGSRSAEKGDVAVKELQSRQLPGSVEMIALDVTNDDSIERAATTVERNHGRLDILVNNAGIGAMNPPLRQQMRDAFDTNATGPAVLTEIFAPLLEKSSASPRIVNISSGAGSINRRLDPSSVIYKQKQVQYRASKAALSMVTACQWVDHGPAIKVFAFCPGFTQSSLSEHNTTENGAKPTAEAVMPLIDILEGKRDNEAGQFLHSSGTYPW